MTTLILTVERSGSVRSLRRRRDNREGDVKVDEFAKLIAFAMTLLLPEDLMARKLKCH